MLWIPPWPLLWGHTSHWTLPVDGWARKAFKGRTVPERHGLRCILWLEDPQVSYWNFLKLHCCLVGFLATFTPLSLHLQLDWHYGLRATPDILHSLSIFSQFSNNIPAHLIPFCHLLFRGSRQTKASKTRDTRISQYLKSEMENPKNHKLQLYWDQKKWKDGRINKYQKGLWCSQFKVSSCPFSTEEEFNI